MSTDFDLSREQRLHTRYRVNLAATLEQERGSVRECRVRDLCSGGLFLELDTHTPGHPLPGEHCHLDIELPDVQNPLRIDTEVARITPSGIGMRFIEWAAGTREQIDAFIRHAENEGIAPIHSDQAMHHALAQLRALSEQQLPQIIHGWSGQLIEELWKHCDTTDSESRRSLFSSEIRLLVQARQTGQLVRHVRQSLDELLSDAREVNEEGSRELAPLDQELFETWLVKSELNHRLEQQLKQPLSALRSQAVHLPGNPLLAIEPESLLELLEHSLHETGITDAVLRIALRIAGYSLAEDLVSLYHTLSHDWTQLGFAPDVALMAPAASQPPGHSGHEDESGSRWERLADAEHETERVSSRPLLSELLTQLRSPEAQPLIATSTVAFAALARQVRALDAQVLERPCIQHRIALSDQLLASVLGDRATPRGLRSVLERIPGHFLAMALAHPGALFDGYHPLIRLLGQIEQFVQRLPNGRRDDADYQSEFEDLRERLVESDPHDLDTLQLLTEQMRGLNARLDALGHSNHEHWIRVCEMRERHRKAREQVRLQINAALTARRVHPIVLETLHLGWRTLLEAVYLDSGPQSQRWRHHWRTLWQLHLDTGGDNPEAMRAPERGNPLVLLEELLDGLGTIGLTPWECTELTGRIMRVLEQAREGQIAPEVYRPFQALTPGLDDGPDPVPTDVSRSDWESAIAQVDALPVDTLIWNHEHGRLHALRLVWRSYDGSRLGLSDPLGKRLSALRRGRLAWHLINRHISITPLSAQNSLQRAATAALNQMQNRVHEQDHLDPLTALAKPHQLRGALIDRLAQTTRYAGCWCLALVQLDAFSPQGDQPGCAPGEQLLGAVAECLDRHLPKALSLVYLEHGCFAALTTVRDEADALALGESLRSVLGSLELSAEHGLSQGLTISVGLSLVNTGTRQRPEHHLAEARLACLSAQRKSGDRVLLFRESDPAIREQINSMLGCQPQDLETLKAHWQLRYQPIAPLSSPDPSGLARQATQVEILLSVCDASGQSLNLADFLAAADAVNLMPVVDRHVTDTSLRWLHEHPDHDPAFGALSINLSGQTLDDPEFANWVGERLAHWTVAPSRLGFELTDTAAITNIERTLATLEALKALGCPLALDDFGAAGLSNSYHYLRRLPVEVVKIDRTFIQALERHSSDQTLVRTLNGIAHFMGRQTLAEGVESAETLAQLREIGIDQVQGYAIARPRLIDEV